MNPARNLYRVDMLNVSYHSPMMRALHHASYVFEKRLSHTADSQDQRHRMVPASRPLMTFADTATPDYVTPRLIRRNPAASAVYERAMRDAWAAKNRLLALGVPLEFAIYVLPNATALRLVESGSFIALQHKWTLGPASTRRKRSTSRRWTRSSRSHRCIRASAGSWARRASSETGSCRRDAPRARTSVACRCGTASRRPSGACSVSSRKSC